MTIVADESVDYRLVTALRKKGYNIFSIQESISGITDQEVLKIAEDKKSLLLTEDKDFGELIYRMKLSHFGILLLRINDMDVSSRILLVIKTLEAYPNELRINFSVITKHNVRVKKTTL